MSNHLSNLVSPQNNPQKQINLPTTNNKSVISQQDVYDIKEENESSDIKSS